MSLDQFLVSNPSAFMAAAMKDPSYLSLKGAQALDELDPLAYTAELFDIDPDLLPFAGHSLGPLFKPVQTKINETLRLQRKLHEGHFDKHPDFKNSGHWFGCDRHAPSLAGAKQLLGFKEDCEFNFTARGLSDNLAMLIDTFTLLTADDMKSDKPLMAILDTEFFSDRAVASTVLQRNVNKANAAQTDEAHDLKQMNISITEDRILKIKPDKNGIYATADIIKAIRDNAEKLQVICLPDIVFSTGQRLELKKILDGVRDLIDAKKIRVILDLAHSVGNRKINLEELDVTAAVGCGYKHLSGPAGSHFGIYVSRKADLKKYQPSKGWLAAKVSLVFPNLNKYSSTIMDTEVGALAFKTSNPPPISLHAAQVYCAEFGKIGFDNLFNKSECLTRYLISQLQKRLGNEIEIITPLDPDQRGATIVLRVKNCTDGKVLEDKLKAAGLEIDVRPPDVIRITAHYGYTKFADIRRFVSDFKCILKNKPTSKARLAYKKAVTAVAFGVGVVATATAIAAKTFGLFGSLFGKSSNASASAPAPSSSVTPSM